MISFRKASTLFSMYKLTLFRCYYSTYRIYPFYLPSYTVKSRGTFLRSTHITEGWINVNSGRAYFFLNFKQTKNKFISVLSSFLLFFSMYRALFFCLSNPSHFLLGVKFTIFRGVRRSYANRWIFQNLRVFLGTLCNFWKMLNYCKMSCPRQIFSI